MWRVINEYCARNKIRLVSFFSFPSENIGLLASGEPSDHQGYLHSLDTNTSTIHIRRPFKMGIWHSPSKMLPQPLLSG